MPLLTKTTRRNQLLTGACFASALLAMTNSAAAAPDRSPRSHFAMIGGQGVTSSNGTPTDPYTAENGSSPYTLTISQKKSADALAKRIVAAMTFDQKVAYVGTSQFGALTAFNVPMLVSSEGTNGVSATELPSVAYPSAVSLAATWDPQTAALRGLELARDAQAGGVQMVNGPGMNMYRTSYGGRESEFLAGEDPILGAVLGTAYVEGEQSGGVLAELKHIFANDQESNRTDINETIDERTLHELYEVPFEAAVKIAEPAAIMCAFPAINGIHACEDKTRNVGMVERQWGFAGFIQSDFGAIYDAGAALAAHTATDASGGSGYNLSTISTAIQSGAATQDDLDHGIERVLRQLLYFQMGANVGNTSTRTEPLRTEAQQFSEQSAEEGIVLLKNRGHNLPISTDVHKIAVLGSFVDQPPLRPVGSGYAPYRSSVSLIAGLRAAAPAGTQIDVIGDNTLDPAISPTVSGWQASYFSAPNWQGSPVRQEVDSAINFDWSTYAAPGCSSGTCGSAAWTAQIRPNLSGDYVFKVYSDGAMQVVVDGQKILASNDTPTTGSDGLDMPRAAFAKMALTAGKIYNVTVTYSYESYWASFSGAPIGARFSYAALTPSPELKKYDSVIVTGGLGGEYEGEGIDHAFVLPEYQSELISNVASINNHTTALLFTSSAVDLRDFNDKAASVVYGWYPGQEGGTAVAKILFGKTNPSGKLPITIDRDVADNAAARNFPMPINLDYTGSTFDLPYTEGVYTGYRGYDRAGIKPLYAFGHGLSYTQFDYTNLQLTPAFVSRQSVITASFDVTNSGGVDGAEAAQVYVSEPHASVDRPEKELKGFAKQFIAAGQTKHYSVSLPLRAFAHYDATKDEWIVDASSFVVEVGAASDKLDLKARFSNDQRLILSPRDSLPIVDPGFKKLGTIGQ